MELKLIVEKGVHHGLEFLKHKAGTYQIGRLRGADLALTQDGYVSREHCRIQVSKDGAWVQHAGGQSGTFVNSRPRRNAPLSNGDALVVGRSLVRVYLDGVAPPPKTIKRPTSVKGFELLKQLPSDSSGQVWWASSEISDHIVTLHVLRVNYSDEVAVQRFLQQAETCARLRHPGLLRFWTQGIKGNVLWFATDLAEGHTLEQFVTDRSPLSVTQALMLMQEIIEIVAYLHQEDVIHRALRPASLRVQRRDGVFRVQLTDLGSSKCFHSEELQLRTRTGECGYPIHVYTPREALIDLKHLDPRSDVYALGGMLYFLLSGRPPYQPAEGDDLVLTILETDPMPLSELRPSLPQGLVNVVEKALARDVEARYDTVEELRQALFEDDGSLAVLRRQLAAARENLRLIEERETEYVLDVNIPLELVKQKRRLQERITQLEAQIAALEQD